MEEEYLPNTRFSLRVLYHNCQLEQYFRGVIPARLIRDSMCRGFRANPLLSQGLVRVEMRADTLAGSGLHNYDGNVGRI